jgi:hypothetical protein
VLIRQDALRPLNAMDGYQRTHLGTVKQFNNMLDAARDRQFSGQALAWVRVIPIGSIFIPAPRTHVQFLTASVFSMQKVQRAADSPLDHGNEGKSPAALTIRDGDGFQFRLPAATHL